MADIVEAPSSGSILDELMKDEPSSEEETTKEGKSEEDEEIIPDHDFKLNEESDDEEEVEEEEEVEDDEEKKDDEEDEEKEVDLENEDEVELTKIPRRAEIKAAYPDIFKKFPQLEHAIYRNEAYTQVFPTVNDAKEAKSEIEEYKGFQGELLKGNIEGVLRSVKNADPKAFAKISDQIIDSLVRVDPNSHLPTTRKITKGILYQVNQLAKSNIKKNPEDKQAQQLEIATEILHDAIFNTKEVELDREVQQEREDPDRKKFQEEKDLFNKTRFTDAFNGVTSKVNNVLTKAVTNEIDTKSILPPYVKDMVIKDVMKELDRQLVQDKPFKALVDKLWLKAQEAGFSNESKQRIELALRNKAKTILPAIMKAKKGEALKGLSVKREEKREVSRNTGDKKTTPDKKNITLSRKEGDRLTPREGESKLAFLMRD